MYVPVERARAFHRARKGGKRAALRALRSIPAIRGAENLSERLTASLFENKHEV